MMQRRPIAVTTQPRKKPIWSFYTRLYHIYIIYIHTYMYGTLHSIIRISPSWWHRFFFSRFFSWRRSVVTTSVHCTLLTKTNDRRTNSNEDSGLGANKSDGRKGTDHRWQKKGKKNASQHLRGPFWILGKKTEVGGGTSNKCFFMFTPQNDGWIQFDENFLSGWVETTN